MIKKIIKTLLILAFCTGLIYVCYNSTKPTKHIVIRGEYVNKEQLPIDITFYRGTKEANELWFTETSYNIIIWTLRIGKKYKIRFERDGIVKWLYVDAKKGDNYDVIIDFNNTKDIIL